MGMFFNLRHTLPGVDKSSQVPPPPLYGQGGRGGEGAVGGRA